MNTANTSINKVNELINQATVAPTAVRVNDTHQAIVKLVNQLNDADDLEFKHLFVELLAQIEMQIGKQNFLMKRSRYPGRITHHSEYLRILGQLAHLRRQVLQGNLSTARVFVRTQLADWFNTYGAAMDAALTAHLRAG
jgi:hemerythrin